jgi:hypothetical protein
MAARRVSTRAMLAHVALAPDLPMPKDIYFYDGTMHLGFELLSSASAWCEFLGGTEEAPGVHKGNRYFRHDYKTKWHGWQIDLSAREPVKTVRAVPALPGNLTSDLSSLVSSDQAAA